MNEFLTVLIRVIPLSILGYFLALLLIIFVSRAKSKLILEQKVKFKKQNLKYHLLIYISSYITIFIGHITFM